MMTINKRERRLIGLAVIVGLALFAYVYGFEPLQEWRQSGAELIPTREAQLERTDLTQGQAHGAQEVIGPERDIVAFEIDLNALDKSARIIEAVGQRTQVLEEGRAIDTEPARHALDRVIPVVGEFRNQG